MGEIKTGDYFVTATAWRFYARGPISRLTEKLVYTRSSASERREFQTRLSEVLFWGSLEDVNAVCRKLQSSSALKNEEKIKADERYNARNLAIIHQAHPTGAPK